MRKLIVILFVFWANMIFAQTSAYYESAVGLQSTELKTALYNIIKGHTEYTYDQVWDILKMTDQDTGVSENVIMLYSGQSYIAAIPGATGGEEYRDGTGWSREHVWAKSRGDLDETTPGPGTDVHHLRPEDVSVNSLRNNRAFDNCINCEEVLDNGLFTGSYTDADLWTFEPRDAVKGDVARMIFYMAVRYEGENGEPDLELTEDILPNSDGNPVHGRLSTLIEWNREDPVDDWERNRNEIIYTDYQHNRNPFIDYPDLVEHIWGHSTSKTWPQTFSTFPWNGETNVAVNTSVRFVFAEAMRKLDDSEITNADLASLILLNENNAGGSAVAFTATIDDTKKIITITPSADLKNNQLYYVSIDGIEDSNGVAFDYSGLNFTTTAILNAWINEIHYDNVSTDAGESIEVIIENPSAFELNLFTITLYNGDTGAPYGTTTTVDLFTEGESYGNFTVYSNTYPVNGIQNGGPDGIALSYNNTLIQFLSYEGAFTAVGGIANGLMSTDIGEAETGTTPLGHSIQLSNTGLAYSAFVWQSPAIATLGTINNGQSLFVETAWTGAINSDWSNSGNWTHGLPTANYNVSIPAGAQVDLSGTYAANNLTIESGAALTVNGNIKIGGDINVKSNATLSGSLIINASGGILNASNEQKTINYQRYILGNQWQMFGSPLIGQSISSFLTNLDNNIKNDGIGNYSMKHYVENPEAWSANYTLSVPNTDIALGRAYVVKRNSNGIISLFGQANSAVVNVPITRNANGWNLLSNPFTSAIAAKTGTINGVDNLISTNTAVLDANYNAIYLWVEGTDIDSESTNNYRLINNADADLVQDYLQVGQGFFVKSALGGGLFTMSPAMQAHQTSVPYKASSDWTKIKLNAEISNAIASTKMAYRDDMSRGLDIGYDAGLLNSYPEFALYSRLIEDNGVDFGLQCLPTDFDNLVVPIGLDAQANEIVKFSIEASNLAENYAVVLEDRLLHTFTNLSESDYNIQLNEAAAGIGRFYVHTVAQSTLGFDDLSQEKAFQVFARADKGQLIIRGDVEANTRARVYSISGKLMADVNLKQINENQISFNAETGVYLVQISNAKGVYTEKISWVR